jgi:hypothetical protein
MHFASFDLYFANLSVLLLYPADEIADHSLILVAYLQIINMPLDCHLGLVDQFICNAWVIGVHLKTKLYEIATQLHVEQ